MAIAGKNGKVSIGATPTTVASIKNWSLELSMDALETTALGDDWKNYIAGLKEWSASAEGDYSIHTDTTGQKALQDAYLGGTVVTVKLYVNDSSYYSGEAFIASMSVEDPVDDVVSISLEFTGNGALSFTKGTETPLQVTATSRNKTTESGSNE